MALTDFFRINLPYGIRKSDKGEWVAFNREYQQLGTPTTEVSGHQLPEKLYVKYSGISEKKLLQLAGDEKFVNRGDDGKITIIWLYDDASNPQSNKGFWDIYFEKIKILSGLERKMEI
jgi:hypothetical protein